MPFQSPPRDGGRSQIFKELYAEIIGPDPHGKPLKIQPTPEFLDFKASLGPWIDEESGEEILNDFRIRPMRRYASGVLFPEKDTERAKYLDDAPIIDPDDDAPEIEQPKVKRVNVADSLANDYELTTANELDPRSGAISLVLPAGGEYLRVIVTGAYYEEFEVKIKSNLKDAPNRTWYVRRPIKFTAEMNIRALKGLGNKFHELTVIADRKTHPLRIGVYCYLRKLPERSEEFLTVSVKNNSTGGSCSTHGLFQTEFRVECLGSEKSPLPIPPYPEREDSVLLINDSEARSLSLLYRNFPTFAVGHGCSATWSKTDNPPTEVMGHYFPSHEVPSVTPDITDSNKNPLEISMSELAGLDGSTDQFNRLDQLVNAYQDWITRERAVVAGLPSRLQVTASQHLDECGRVLDRMLGGIALLRSDANVRRAFELANEAVYHQQMNTPLVSRKITVDKNNIRKIEPKPAKDISRLGKWRPFQIGFLLTALSSTANSDDQDRETVELIFFPTGGGKTEAYQALIAFSLFLNRLRDTDQQVGAIMRYTLRLLTTQQFTRGASLICSMELVRRKHGIPGQSFSIGIWVGGSVTSNSRADALSDLKSLHKSSTDEHKFLLTRCPYCGTDFGKIPNARAGAEWPAFRESTSPFTGGKKTVVFTCPDQTCPFHSELAPLPIWVIDEDIYERRPSLVIATVDKFAQVAFSGDIGRLFGLDENGTRLNAPPSLIVQDELHLISGPLGTMVGLYEWLFEELCIDRRESFVASKPKIVCSTATIRSYKTQIRSLYAREQAQLFPPHGLSIEDSFFARYARDPKTDKLEQGRLYLGLLGTSLRSTQDMQVRVTAALLQAPKALPRDQQDPWYTLLSFFNRISDIGTSFNLIHINVVAHLRSIWSRQGLDHASAKRRYVNQGSILELTGRIKDADLPKAIDRLFDDIENNAVDTCLASNIIEVGVDIPRLSLLSILGQPKTNSQYIQVTGRVGRNWQTRPGLIVTIYPPRRPRDRSHFEKFRAFHQRLYAFVEPTSVTPFSTPAMERALHAIIVGYVRNFAPQSKLPMPVPTHIINAVVARLRDRVAMIDARQLGDFDLMIKKRIDQWLQRQRTVWEGKFNEDSLPLIFRAGTFLPTKKASLAWSTPPTMRNVDAECVVEIDDIYVRRAAEESQ